MPKPARRFPLDTSALDPPSSESVSPLSRCSHSDETPDSPLITQPRSVVFRRSAKRRSTWSRLLKAAAPRWGSNGRAALALSAPPWLFSLLLHMLLLLVLALWLVPSDFEQVVRISAVFADSIGEQLNDETVEVGLETDDKSPSVTSPDKPVVTQPLAAPPVAPPVDLATTASSDPLVMRELGTALDGREPGRKQSLLAAYGGTEFTEAAVHDGLKWLRRHQRTDGSWALNGPFSDGAASENSTAATAMALIAFQGAGHTHRAGPYQRVVKRGMSALLRMQDADGNFFHGINDQHRLYSQAQAMIAICELYGMTQDPQLRTAAERSVGYAVQTQAELGGWKYQPGVNSDTSVTGWFMMGLQSARMAGLEVPPTTLERLSGYLDRAATANGARYSYEPGEMSTDVMTAEALLCRQYLGWSRDDPRLQTGMNLILARPIDWDDRDVYYWYYATQVLHHVGGPEWHKWNAVMRRVLPDNQTQSGPEKGSWFPMGDRWGPHGGRLYVTCMSLFMLEVYYRHLPIYDAP